MAYLKKIWTIAQKDLKLELRTFENLSAMLLFSLIVLVIFAFAFDFATIKFIGIAKLIPGVIWITFTFSAIIGFSRSFSMERERECLLALILSPADSSAIYLGKMVANFIIVSILEMIILPLSAIFFNYNILPIILPLFLIVALNTIGFSEIGTLFAALASKVNRGEALLSILLFPISTPLIISAVKATTAVLEGKELAAYSNWLMITAGFDVIFFFGSILLFEYIIEE